MCCNNKHTNSTLPHPNNSISNIMELTMHNSNKCNTTNNTISNNNHNNSSSNSSYQWSSNPVFVSSNPELVPDNVQPTPDIMATTAPSLANSHNSSNNIHNNSSSTAQTSSSTPCLPPSWEVSATSTAPLLLRARISTNPPDPEVAWAPPWEHPPTKPTWGRTSNRLQ